MKLIITAIRDAGDLAKERIVFKADAAIDVGEYVLLQTGFREDSLTNSVFHTYWFPDKDIGARDFVVLYTKAGTSRDKEFKEVISHFFYWGKASPIWSEQGRSAVLLHAPDWDSFRE
jgi:hypothetical protein